MNHDDLIDLRPLANPADVELRSALSVLLQRILVDPGGLFNPVYVGPLRDADLLTEEVQRVAAATGLRMLSVNEVTGRDAAQAGIALLSEREAARIAKYGGRPGGAVQVVIWGRHAAEALTTIVQEWVEGGLEFDPEVDGRSHEPRPIAEAVRRLADPGEGEPRALVWVGPPSGDQEMIAEVRLRWALEANAPVTDVVVPAEDGALDGARGCVVLRLSGASGPDGARRAWSQARALLGRGVKVFLATDPVGETALRLAGPDGPSDAEASWLWQASGAVENDEIAWPGLDETLIGPPVVGRRRRGTAEIPLHETPLIEVLRGAAKGQQAGTFVIYEAGRLGFIQVANGEIRGARRVQERQEAGTAAETVARIRDIARWPHARSYFVPRNPDDDDRSWGTGCRLPLDTVAFDLATMGRGSSGFASFEQQPGDVAAALATWGLVTEAIAVLREPSRQAEMGARGHFLLGHFRAGVKPEESALSFREAVRHLVLTDARDGGRSLALDAGLNALIVEVRAGFRTAGSAWQVILASSLDEVAALADAPDRALIVLEIAVRAGARGAVERLGRWLIGRGAGGELPARILRRFATAPQPTLAADLPAELTMEVAERVVLEAVGGAR